MGPDWPEKPINYPVVRCDKERCINRLLQSGGAEVTCCWTSGCIPHSVITGCPAGLLSLLTSPPPHLLQRGSPQLRGWIFTETSTLFSHMSSVRFFTYPLLSVFLLFTQRETRRCIDTFFAPADRDSATLGSARRQMGPQWPEITPNTSSLSHLTRTYYKENEKD